MRRILLAALLVGLWANAAWADEWLARGDELARWGAYLEAEEAYRQSQSPEGTVLMRRLSVAEMMLDAGAVASLAGRLSQVAGSDPEARMRIALARATLAARAWHAAEAREHYEAAGALAAQLDTPAAALTTYLVGSFRIMDRWEQVAPPSPQEFHAAAAEVARPLAALGNYPDYPPLDYMRAAHWNRVWVWYALGLAGEQPDRAAAWLKTANDYALLNIQIGGDRARKAGDPEAGSMTMHYILDMAEHLFVDQGVANQYLAAAQQGLGQGDAILAQQSARLGNPQFVEQTRIRARYHRALARSLLTQGKLEEAVSNWDKAATLFEQIRQLADQADTYAQVSFGLALMGRDHGPRALTYAERALNLSRRIDYLWLQAFTAGLKGVIQQAHGDLPGAEQSLREAVRVNERLVVERGATEEGRNRLLGRHWMVTEILVQVLLGQGKQAEAMDIVRRREAGQLLSTVDLGRVRARDPQVQAALKTVETSRAHTRNLTLELAAAEARPPEERATGEIKRIRDDLESNRAEFHKALNLIRSTDPEYERLVSIRPTSFSKIQPKLPADTVLVQYFSGREKLYIFVATAEKLDVVEVPVTRDELLREVRALRAATVSRGGGPATRGRLYDYLIKPVEPHLDGRRTLAIAPSEFLYYVPFSALRSDSYLVERMNVAVVTGLEVFTLFDKPADPVSKLLALGDPDGTLPSARQEVGDVAAMFSSPEVYLQDQATKDKVARLQPGTSVVHFATHGVLNRHDVNSTYLLMAGKGDDGRLTTGEIYGLDFGGVSLVTLSACDTGLGESKSHAEIATLAQAFSVAGSQTMVASLWKVSDSGTHRLMVAFYKHLIAGKSKGEALRQAQLELLKDKEFSDPYYWAAFELLGDWR